jgi:hypothetical protein
MAPALPEIDVDQIAELDRKQAYYLLFEFMKDDFLTRDDFNLHVAAMTAPPSAFKVVDAMAGAFPLAQVRGLAYSLLAKSGAVFKEQTIGLGEKVIE